MKIPRTTSAGANNGHKPAWFDWHGGVILICPQGHRAVLRTATIKADEHVIKDDGSVEPSVACTECDFHQTVTLQDWVPQRRLVPST